MTLDLTGFPLARALPYLIRFASLSLFGISFAWLSTHIHDYDGRLWQ